MMVDQLVIGDAKYPSGIGESGQSPVQTKPENDSYKPDKVKCVANDEYYIRQETLRLFKNDDRVLELLKDYGLDQGIDKILEHITKYALEKAPEKLGKKIIPIYGQISTGKDIIDLVGLLSDLNEIYDEKYNQAKYRFNRHQLGEAYDKYYLGAQR